MINKVKMTNAGKYNRLITIFQVTKGKDQDGFPVDIETKVLSAYAEVKTLRGYTLLANNSDFDKAYVNFTIRYPHNTVITRDMLISFRDKVYTIEYLNNVDFANVELEIQAKEVTK